MSEGLSGESIQNTFVYPFRDSRWKNKLLIGSLLMLAGYIIPVIPIAILYGYCAQIIRRVILGDGEVTLPEWDDWGKLFEDGLKLFGVILIYLTPFFVFFFLGYGVMFLSIFIPDVAIKMPDQRVNLKVVPLIGGFGGMGCFGVSIIWSMITGAFLPVVMGHAVAKDRFSAAFRVTEWWPIFRANWIGFLVAYMLVMGLGIVVGFAVQVFYLTVILCCLLPPLFAFFGTYITLVWSALIAQAYRLGVERLAEGTSAA